MSRRRDLELARAGALTAAGDLVGYLRAGGVPMPVPCSIRLDAGELCYGEGAAWLSQYFALEPSLYGQPAALSRGRSGRLGASAALDAGEPRGRRRRAQAAVQWRPIGPVPVIVTSRRVMACQHGRWLSWWHSGVRQLVPDVAGMSVAMLFDDDRPTRFEGPFAPWLAVLLTRLLYGEILDPRAVSLSAG